MTLARLLDCDRRDKGGLDLLWRVGYWLLWEAAWHWNGAEAKRRGGKIKNNSPALKVCSTVEIMTTGGGDVVRPALLELRCLEEADSSLCTHGAGYYGAYDSRVNLLLMRYKKECTTAFPDR